MQLIVKKQLTFILLLSLLIVSLLFNYIQIRYNRTKEVFRAHLDIECKNLPNALEEQLEEFEDFANSNLYDFLVNNHRKRALANYLRVYDAYDENGPIKIIRHGSRNDGGYVVATKALESADVLFGYGICNDNSFEDMFSVNYKKPSYGFDCGISYIQSKSNLFTLIKECISSDSNVDWFQTSSKIISSFNSQRDKLGLRGKKIFVKMDIEGEEFVAVNELINSHENITGIALEVHYFSFSVEKVITLLKKLQKYFVLIHIHGNNCCDTFNAPNVVGGLPRIIELSYINKSLVKNYKISKDQSFPKKIDMPNISQKPEISFEIIDQK